MNPGRGVGPEQVPRVDRRHNRWALWYNPKAVGSGEKFDRFDRTVGVLGYRKNGDAYRKLENGATDRFTDADCRWRIGNCGVLSLYRGRNDGSGAQGQQGYGEAIV